MRRSVFNQYISASDFKGLFVSEMLWNNPSGATKLPDYTIDEHTFQIEQIAERSGFQILQCGVNEIPTSSVCKKLDTKLRKNAENYICIFTVPNTLHHLWVAPVKKVEKRDLVLVEYDTLDKARFLFEKMEGLSFSLDGPQLTILDIIEKVQAAFIINSEKITKDFYAGFKKEHTNFAKFITGIDDHLADKDNKNKQWYTSVMLNRLMFCYFIQKKGFLDGDVDYLRHKLEWTREQEGEDRFFNKFYKGFLVNLFHDGLNAPRHDQEFETIYGRIPYLNGGMFDVHQIEQDYAGLDIADEAFKSLFDFFDKWHWHLDDRMTATGRDINPDVLGYIFEQYINDRAQMGAYYTKEDITEYIGRNTIIPYLIDTTFGTRTSRPQMEKDLWQFLRDSGDRYIYDAVKKGHDQPIPDEIAVGIDTTQPNLLERRSHWNERTPDSLALPTEIWRETIERLQRYHTIKTKIENGEITAINDFITYNLDIRQFVYDYLAQTPNHLFVEYFYDALQHVTILDPTCGSGAFLFAALNILEPLYEVCISRMEEFHEQNSHLFTKQLQEIQNKYRSNIQYFIYKSIILRNLYGVDIMVEATEIAKLRLFLKMVAVVEVDRRDPNLGLDPLPDIDFNIRCGNTLVGYATQREMDAGIAFSDFFTAQEFRSKVSEEMEKVAFTYDVFKTIQLSQTEDMAAFKRAKHDLKVRLTALNDLLNRQMYGSIDSTIDYDSWLRSHQPFHWLAEFYEIINDHGGFDVIIGNPPYVVYTKKDKVTKLSVADKYQLYGYRTIESNNLYCFTIERSLNILSSLKRIGMIVPLSLTSAKNMYSTRYLLTQQKYLAISSYEIRPGKLFDGAKGAEQRLNIFISSSSCNEVLVTTQVMRWASEHRKNLFSNLAYSNSIFKDRIWRFSSPLEISIFEKYSSNLSIDRYQSLQVLDAQIHYRSAGLRYWIIFLRKGFNTESASNKSKHIVSKEIADYLMAALNSNLFWWYYSTNYDMFNLTDANIFEFHLDYDAEHNIGIFASELEKDLDKNKLISIVNKSDGGINQSFAYQKKLSKSIVDKIDILLAKHYCFTPEEIDFILNYNIKYRMGDELNEE